MLASRVIAGVTLLGLAAAPLALAEDAMGDSLGAGEPALRVSEMVFCAGVSSMTPVAVADTFPSDIFSVYCFTRIVGAGDTTAVIHRWYHEDKDLASIELPVKSPLWRTWSSKKMASGLRGRWKVDVTELDGTVIRSGTFFLE
ncbi:MAG: DUF2914 domain-containing protein [bacterium]